MMKKILHLLVLLTVVCTVRAQEADTLAVNVPEPQSVGLVLSGGGAKGIAHIGVIKALEDNGIPIDYISGTSMGAIVGSLYACGYTTDEMLRLIRSRDFTYWSKGEIDKRYTYYFLQDEPSAAMLKLNIGDKESGGMLKSILPSSLINPLPMNFGFLELFAPYTAQCGGNFNRLFVPFRCVASDVIGKKKVVFASGSLGDAVRASMSFPLVFHPIDIDGRPMYDGGIYDNFPIDVMRDTFAPQIMIGVDVSTSDASEDTPSMLAQLETMIMQHSDYSVNPDRGIKIRIHLEEFGLLDFDKATRIYDIGYNKAMEMMDSIKSRIKVRVPAEARELRRQVFKSQTPYLRFDTVTVEGGSHTADNYIRYLFTHNRPDTIGIERARDAYYRAITPGKLRNLVPTATYNDSTGLFRLDLKSSMKQNLTLGIGGYLTTSTCSMLFLSAGYKTINFNSLDLGLNGWVGQSYLAAEGIAAIKLMRSTPSSLQARVTVSRQKYFSRDRMIFQKTEPTTLTSDEYYGQMAYGVAMGRSGRGELSLGYGYLDDKYYHQPTVTRAVDGRDISRQKLARLKALYEYNTLNNVTMPTAGTQIKATGIAVTGKHYYTPFDAPDSYRISHNRRWWQVEVSARHYRELGRGFSLGAGIDLLGSSRKLMQTYTLSVMDAPAFIPSASYSNVFIPGLRANSFGTIGIEPIWRMSSMLQLRARCDMFVPLRPILEADDGTAHYGDYLSRSEFFGQIEAVLALPFANVTAYTHYCTAPGGKWNFGVSFGLFIQAPKFLR